MVKLLKLCLLTTLLILPSNFSYAAADTIPPTGTIIINRGNMYTKFISVTLTLSARDDTKGSGLSRMRFSNDNVNWSSPQSYSTTKRWMLLSGEGIKTVYVKFSDRAGNWSNVYSDTITLAVPAVIIKDVSDLPDPFSPDSDGYKDTTTISATVHASGFNKSRPITWKITISDSTGKTIKKFSNIENAPANSSIKISQVWDGAGNYKKQQNKNGKYTYRIDARCFTTRAAPVSGDVAINLNPQLSVTVSPDYWNIGPVKVDSVTAMNELDKITVTNGSDCEVNYSLCLVNPPGWYASQTSPGHDTYVLNSAFSSRPDSIVWNETNHALLILPVTATSAQFAGDLTGTNVASGEKRPVWLQFKAPKTTSVTKEQDIEVIINAQAS